MYALHLVPFGLPTRGPLVVTALGGVARLCGGGCAVLLHRLDVTGATNLEAISAISGSIVPGVTPLELDPRWQ